MSVRIYPGRLRLEMARRGLSVTELARASDLSAPTVSTALAGRAISVRSLQLIAAALTRLPTIEVIDSLLIGNGSQELS
jgi:transcriptional regulator with XRE-family HTH domain